MKKAIISFGFGIHQEYLAVAAPTFYKYGQRHNYDVILPTEQNIGNLHPGLSSFPYSWWKVPLIKKTLESYDAVLWLDADVVITNFSSDIIEYNNFDISRYAQALTFHQVDVGTVPNCGVWLTSRLLLPYIDLIMSKTQYKNYGWWEQAATMDLMGFDIEPYAKITRKTKLMQLTKEMGLEWNVHCMDIRPKPHEPFFKHATMMNPRLQTMKDWVSP